MEDRLTFEYVLNEINTFNNNENEKYKLSIVRCGVLLTLKIQNMEDMTEEALCHGTLKECNSCVIALTRFISMGKQGE